MSCLACRLRHWIVRSEPLFLHAGFQNFKACSCRRTGVKHDDPGPRNARTMKGLMIHRRLAKWLVVLVPAWLTGQTVRVDLSPPIRESGRTIALIQLSAPPGAEPAAIQWTLLGDTVKSAQIEPGEQAVDAKKQITCATPIKGQMTCLVWGRNRNVVHDGVIAKVIIPGAAFHMRLSRLYAASAEGLSLAVQPSSERDDNANSFLPGLSATNAGIALLAIFALIYLARRLSASHSISKRRRASRRSGLLR